MRKLIKTNSLKLTVCLLLLVSVLGCATISPLEPYFENNFSGFKSSKKDMVKVASLKKSYQNPYDEVWDSALYILAQYAIIIDSSKESGIITYVDIDGVFFADVLIEDNFLYWEFPFTVLIEKEPQGTMVYIYPMTDLFTEKGSKKKWWEIVETGFNQKGEEFLEKLSTQLTAKERWPWLNKLVE